MDEWNALAHLASEVESAICMTRSNTDVRPSGEGLLIDGVFVRLDSLLQKIEEEPDQREQLIEDYLEIVLGDGLDLQNQIGRESALSLLRPRIYHQNFLDGFVKGQLPHVEFLDQLIIGFVLVLPACIQTVTMHNVKRWKLSMTELKRAAIANLVRSSNKAEWMHSDDYNNIVARFNQGDGFDAARLLLPGLYEELSPTLGEQFLVAIPSRDGFLAAPSQLEPQLREYAVHTFGQSDLPITRRLVRVGNQNMSFL